MNTALDTDRPAEKECGWNGPTHGELSRGTTDRGHQSWLGSPDRRTQRRQTVADVLRDARAQGCAFRVRRRWKDLTVVLFLVLIVGLIPSIHAVAARAPRARAPEARR